MKREFLILFVLFTCILFWPRDCKAAERFEKNDIEYMLNDDRATVTAASISDKLSENNKSLETFVVPATVEMNGKNYKVSRVSSFLLSHIITNKLVFEEGIQEINFPDKGLHIAEIFIPSSVNQISGPTDGSKYCKSINVSTDNKSYMTKDNMLYSKDGKLLYMSFSNLESIVLPDGVEEIMPYAFYFSKVKKISFPDSLKTIHELGFKGCQNLRNISFGKNIKNFSYDVFDRVVKIKKIVISKKNPYLKCVKGAIYSKNMKTLLFGSVSQKNMKISNKTKIIRKGAFAYHTNPKKVIFLNKMISIPEECFLQSKVKEVVLPDTVKSIGKSAFSDCKQMRTIALPASLLSIKEKAFYNCGFRKLVIPKKVINIEENALQASIVNLIFKGKKVPVIENQEECLEGKPIKGREDNGNLDDEDVVYNFEYGIGTVQIPRKSASLYKKAVKNLPYRKLVKYIK